MVLDTDQARAFASVALALQQEDGRDATVEAVTALAVDTIPGCDFARVTITKRKSFQTMAPTDPLVLSLDHLGTVARSVGGLNLYSARPTGSTLSRSSPRRSSPYTRRAPSCHDLARDVIRELSARS